MLEMIGPKGCKDRAVFEIFRQNRFMITLAAIATRCVSFQSTLEWKSLPWKIQGTPKGCMDELLDLVADLPSLRTDKSSPSANTSLSILRGLDKWYNVWYNFLDSNLVSSPSSRPDYPRTWTDSLASSSLLAANCFCTYNAAVIMCIDHALRAATTNDFRPGDASVLFHQRHESAVGICRMLDYHFTSGESALGGFFMLWPVRMAAKVLLKSGTLEESTWLKQRLGGMMQSELIWSIRQETLEEIYDV